MYVLFVCRTTFPNAGTKCACLDWWFINSRFSSVKPRTFTSLEGGGVLRSTGIWLNLSEKKKRGGGGWLCRIFFPLVQIVTNSCGIKRKGQTLTNSVIICKKSNNLTHVPSIFYLEQECLCTVQCMKCKPDKNTCHRKIWSLYYFVDIGISAVSNFFQLINGSILRKNPVVLVHLVFVLLAIALCNISQSSSFLLQQTTLIWYTPIRTSWFCIYFLENTD